MFEGIRNYFAEFKILKTVSREYWLTNAIQFFDGLSYFSVIIVISMYLSENVGFTDVDAGLWQGIFFLFITAFMFSVGAVCDVIGVKKTFYIATLLLLFSRLGLGVAPSLLPIGPVLNWVVIGLLIVMAMGTATLVTNTNAALRHFTNKKNRGTGFNMYYLIMNIGAMLAGFAVVDGFRSIFGPVNGNLAILNFGFAMALITFIISLFIREGNIEEKEEYAKAKEGVQKTPLQIFMEVWKEKPFQKLILFLVLTLGVRLVFTHQSMVMPKYYLRTIYSDFELGLANSLNPFIIVIGLILFIPIINKFNIVKLIVIGMTISALSLLFLAVPNSWIFAIPGIHNMDQAYIFIIVMQIFVFAVGELIFSPRFMEYVASVAPKDKVGAYMGLSMLPMFIARPINGFVSGFLIQDYCYDGIRAKIDAGDLPYTQSPEFMWLIYFILAALSPVLVILLRKKLSSEPEPATSPDGEAILNESPALADEVNE